MSWPRVTLVLGAGGPVGHAFHAGLLRALSQALGWDPREAELVLGTSAGAQVGALLRAGMSADDLAARAAGEPLTPRARPSRSTTRGRRTIARAQPPRSGRPLRGTS
ncbi:MAG: hypothetical protein M5U28_09490 [Sandaracinaceae bacterium]|nr:hypothetical protein [Sandaracinaceae bacterium]